MINWEIWGGFFGWGETAYLIKVAWWLQIHKVKFIVKLEEVPKYFWIEKSKKKTNDLHKI